MRIRGVVRRESSSLSRILITPGGARGPRGGGPRGAGSPGRGVAGWSAGVEAAVDGPAGGLVPVGELELAEDVAHVGLDGLLGDVELLADAPVGVAAGQPSQHLALPV